MPGKRGPVERPLEERFWEKVAKSEGCWLWTGAPIKRGGYGQIYVGNQSVRRAHRVAWEFGNGRALSPDEHVLHRCDAPLCVRPDHLFLGDQVLNMADMRAKGREFTFTTENAERGTDRHNAKLNEDKVRWIRSERAKDRSYHSIAVQLGVTDNAVKSVVYGLTWKHVS